MSTWRKLAVALFPQHRHGVFGFQRPDTSIYQVFFALFEDAKHLHAAGNDQQLRPIYAFAEWCFSQRQRAPELWNAAATAFYEHLADDDTLAAVIPNWVPEAIFKEMRDEFEMRRERCGSGKFQQLLQQYNAVRQTRFE